MQIGCLMENFAHGLNPKSQLVMSFPGLTYTGPEPYAVLTVEEHKQQFDAIQSSAEHIALERRLKQLFIDNHP